MPQTYKFQLFRVFLNSNKRYMLSLYLIDYFITLNTRKGCLVMAVSEVAQLRQRIADEYLAAKWGLTGLAYGTSQHKFITARIEHMGESLTTLIDLVGSPQVAAKILADTLEDLPERPTRCTI